MVRKTRPAQGPGPPREQSPPPLPAALSPSPATPSQALTDPTVARRPDFEFTGPPPAAGSPLASDGHVRYQSAPAILGSAAPRSAPPPPPARPSALLPPPAAQRRLRGNKVLRAGDSAAAAARGFCSAIPATLAPYFPSVCVCACVSVCMFSYTGYFTTD